MRGAVAPLVISNASEDQRFRDHPALHHYGINSYIAVPLKRRDGSTFGVLCALDPRPTPLSEEHLETFQLMANLIAFELEAEEQVAQQQTVIRTLEDFVAIAAHDLRQPLTVLLGRVQLLARRLRRGVPAADVLPSVEALAVDTRRIVALSDDLLDVARLQTGQFELDRTTFNLTDLAERLLEEVQTIAPQHSFLLQAPATVMIDADERKFSQVLRNLLGNAAKYTRADDGPIVVQISSEGADNLSMVVLKIVDQGPGVDEDDLSKLFERHYRTKQASAQQINGSGLGLYIVAQMIAAHGGTIWAEHTPGGGLTICIQLAQQA